MNALEQLSESLASAVQLAGEGVVRVEGRRRIPSSGIVWAGDGLVVAGGRLGPGARPGSLFRK